MAAQKLNDSTGQGHLFEWGAYSKGGRLFNFSQIEA